MSQNMLESPARPLLRIFVSSPGDVAEERLIAKRILDRLAAEFAQVAKINPIFWEHEPLLASGSFQEQISLPSQAEIVICILWSRLGTRLPHEFKNPDGTPRYKTGTEFEVDDALEGRKQHGSPDLLVYRKTSEPLVSLKDPQATIQAAQQKILLDQFVQRFFHGEGGTLISAFHPFDNAADFETRLEEHLRKLIETRLEELGSHIEGGGVRPTWTEGCPFRGLQVFEFEHQAIFFGRTRAIDEVLDRLRRQAAAGRTFLLVLGASGCGKSSLVRAGVLPLLVQPAVVEGVGLWKRAILRPSERAGDLFDGLAVALLRPEALPELASDGATAEKMANMLRANPDAAPLLVKGSLCQAASQLRKAQESAVRPDARLVLVLDQLEELFTAGDLTPDHRVAFFRAIRALAESGQTWVVATLRSDFYHRCAEIPALLDLKAGAGQYDLTPPDPSEIAQLVRRPAFAAGLRFEENSQTGDRLDDHLRDAATVSHDSLPLLEFTLDELYHRRSGNVLRLAAYQELGGMEGALAQRANEVFERLPEAAKNALPSVFRQLVSIGGIDDETPARRQAPLAVFDATRAGKNGPKEVALGTTPARRLVDAFIAARLLTAKETEEGTPVVEVVHEALLRRWQPLVEWLRQDRELLRIHGRIAAAAARWNQDGRPDSLLLQPGKPLDEGRQLQAAGFLLSTGKGDCTEGFITASSLAAHRRTRIRRATIAALCALAILASIGGLTSYVMSVRATANAKRADEKAAEAELQRTEAVSQLLRARTAEYAIRIGVAQRDLAENDYANAEDTLKECASDLRDWEYRYFWTSLCKRRIMVLLGHAEKVSSVAFSPDGRRIVSGGRDTMLKVWDVETSHESLTLKGHTAEVTSVAFSPDNRRIVSASADKTLKIWDAATGKEVLTLTGHRAAVASATFSPDSRQIVSGSWDHTLKLWDAATGREILTLAGHKAVVASAAFSPDGRRIVSGSEDKTLKIWDAATGRQILTLNGHRAGVNSVAFSPDGRRIVSGSKDRTLKIWDSSTGREIFTLPCHTSWVSSVAFSPDGRQIASGSGELTVWDATTGQETLTINGHTRPLSSVAFSPDGRSIVSGGGYDKTVKVWNAAADQKTLTLDGHTGGVTSVALSPDGRRVVAGNTDHRLKVWDLETGQEALTFSGHTNWVSCVAFSPDGRRIVSGGAGSTLKVWDAATGQETLTLKGVAKLVLSVAFSPDGRRIVSGGADNAPTVWDATTGQETLTLKGHTSAVTSVAFSPDGRRIASGSEDTTLKLWDATTGRETFTLKGHLAMVSSVAFSPDSRRIVSGSEDKTLKVWDATTGQETFTLKGHTAMVKSVAFSPNGRRIVSGSADNALKLWDTVTGQGTLTLKGHTAMVSGVAFSPDGRWIVSGSSDKTLKVWDAGTGSDADKRDFEQAAASKP